MNLLRPTQLLCWFGVSAAVAGPLSPRQELATFSLADPDLIVELAAAEPDLDSPVAIAWDANGRLFAAEMSDYPRSSEKGRIRLLEDTDGDGRYDRSIVFADDLAFPTSVLPWKEGLFVTAAPALFYLKDTDGDGRADERKVIYTGFGEGNQQLRVNGLFWGLDNWIYGANGRSDGEVRRPGMDPVSIRGHDFRFDPRTLEFEAIAGRSQFGTTRDDWGNRFLSWNTIPIRHEVMPERYLKRLPPWTGQASLADIMPSDDSNRVYPLTPAPLTFNDESTTHFNALSGLIIYRGDALGEDYRGDAFVGESLRNLVHRRKLVPKGETFQAVRADTEHDREFLASTDPWFHPVNFATGPDGALYVVDFYRRFVEHPDFVPEKLRASQPWQEGVGHGRIWRVRRAESLGRPLAAVASKSASAALVEALNDQNGWTRDTAQRLLVERNDPSVEHSLHALVRNAPLPETRVQALWTAHARASIGELLVDRLRNEPDPRVRRQAMIVAEQVLGEFRPRVEEPIRALLSADQISLRHQALLSLTRSAPIQLVDVLIRSIHRDAHDPYMRAALVANLGQDPDLVHWLLKQDPALRTCSVPGAPELLEQLGEIWGAFGPVTPPFSSEAMASTGGIVVAAGILKGLGLRQQDLGSFLAQGLVSNLVRQARVLLSDETAPMAQRRSALRVASAVEPEQTGPLLFRLVRSTNGLEIAAAQAVVRSQSESLILALLRGWKGLATPIRQAIQQEATRHPIGRQTLVLAAEQGSVPWTELARHVRDALAKETNPAWLTRVRTLESNAPGIGRAQVIVQFQGALALTGDPERGGQIFIDRCIICHRRGDQGQQVGPDLSGIRSRPAEALLADILDPSRQVTPDYTSYTVETLDGDTWTGLLTEEDGDWVQLRLAGGEERTLPRTRIRTLQANQKSLMPDGLEEGWSERDLADLLAYLKR